MLFSETACMFTHTYFFELSQSRHYHVKLIQIWNFVLLTTGNHDPSQPRDYENCDRNFLTSNGEKHTICSNLSISNQKENQCIQIDTTLKGAGYKKQLECYQQFGFFP